MNIFENWNTKKQNIEKGRGLRTYRELEIWYINMGKNIGYEQDGKGELFLRPVLIFKKFNKNIFYGIPLTSIIKDNKFHYFFKSTKGNKSCAILSQMRLYDSKRLLRNIGEINFKDMKLLKEKIKELIF